MHVLPACMYMHHTCAWCLWVLKFQVVLNRHEDAENRTYVLCKSNKCCWPLSHLSSSIHIIKKKKKILLNQVGSWTSDTLKLKSFWNPGGGGTAPLRLSSCHKMNILNCKRKQYGYHLDYHEKKRKVGRPMNIQRRKKKWPEG